MELLLPISKEWVCIGYCYRKLAICIFIHRKCINCILEVYPILTAFASKKASDYIGHTQFKDKVAQILFI